MNVDDKQIFKVNNTSVTIENALSPLSNLVWDYDKIQAEFMPELKKKLSNISIENIITPDLTIAGPAVEAIRFSGHKPELRKLYAKLLATSMDKSISYLSHPSFVEIIKQITPDEAKLIKYFSITSILPIVSIQAEHINDYSSVILVRHYSHFGLKAGCEYQDLITNYLDNLSRLELIKIKTDTSYKNEKYYDEFNTDVFLMDYLKRPQIDPDYTYKLLKGNVALTDFGVQFIKACL